MMPFNKQAADDSVNGLLKSLQSPERASNLWAALMPGGTIVKSVKDNEGIGSWLGRALMDAGGGILGHGAGAVAGGKLGGLMASHGAPTSGALIASLATLLGGAGGTYGVDKLVDKMYGPRDFSTRELNNLLANAAMKNIKSASVQRPLWMR